MDDPAPYEIRVAEQFGEQLTAWFSGVQIVNDPEFAGTILRGEMVDQSALFGVLGKIRDLGLTLIAVQRLTPLAKDRESK